MSKADVIEVEGVVVEKLPNAFFKVELENGHQILATISGKPQKQGFYRERRICCEGKIISQTYLREMQSHQEKRKHQNYL